MAHVDPWFGTPVLAVLLQLYPAFAATQAPVAHPQAEVRSAQAAGAAPVGDDEGQDRLSFFNALSQGGELLTADEVAALAVQTAPGIERARAAAAEARHAAAQSLVLLYPRLDLTAHYRRLSRPPLIVYPLPPGLVSGYQAVAFPRPLMDQYLLQAQVRYPVSDLFLSILPRYRAAQEYAQAQTLNLRATVLSVALSARETFYSYIRARAAQLVARFGVSEAEAQLRDVKLLVSTETEAPVEQRQAEARLTAARVVVARADGAVAVARAALYSLMHRPSQAEVAVAEDLTALLPRLEAAKEALVREAFESRSELRALRALVSAQRRMGSAEAAGKLPKLSLGASAEWGNPNPRAALFRSDWIATWEALAVVSWSPSDFALGDARAGQAAAQRAQTLADISELEDALRQEVSQAYEDYNAAREAMAAAVSGITAAEESYRVRRYQARAHAAIATEVTLAEGDLIRARLDLINAAIDLRIARARLSRAVERGDPDP